jgi:hypothetical protein
VIDETIMESSEANIEDFGRNSENHVTKTNREQVDD